MFVWCTRMTANRRWPNQIRRFPRLAVRIRTYTKNRAERPFGCWTLLTIGIFLHRTLVIISERHWCTWGCHTGNWNSLTWGWHQLARWPTLCYYNGVGTQKWFFFLKNCWGWLLRYNIIVILPRRIKKNISQAWTFLILTLTRIQAVPDRGRLIVNGRTDGVPMVTFSQGVTITTK